MTKDSRSISNAFFYILVLFLLLYCVPWTQRLKDHQMYGAALLTRCYTQHALRPFIDSESNHIRRFIKIPSINKGIDFIDFPSIFQDKSSVQSIPTYFQNFEPPIICYKYNKPIRNTIFNFNKLVSDLDIYANTPKF